MLDGDTAEIKMTIRLDTLVWETREKKVMTDIEESETDDDYVESLPNMTGYVVRKGDTLFLLGKQFCTNCRGNSKDQSSGKRGCVRGRSSVDYETYGFLKYCPYLEKKGCKIGDCILLLYCIHDTQRSTTDGDISQL